jgi:carbohydrate-selective porin OprB
LCAVAISTTAPAQEPATQPASTEELQSVPGQAARQESFWESKTLTGDWGGVRPELDKLGFKLDLSYQQQFQQNFRGGLNTHNAHEFSGSYDLVFRLDFGRMDLIPDAGFYFKAKGHYGDGINPEDVGASSAANPNADIFQDEAIFVKKWWYWHRFFDDKVELRLGVLETNKDLVDVSQYANHEDKDFLNKLSIRNATIPHTTGMGAFLKVAPIDWMYFQTVAVDDQAEALHTQFDTAFHDEAWFRGMWELGFTPEWSSAKGPMPGRYRIGWWYKPGPRRIFEDDLDGARSASYRGDNMGLYLGVDQMIWKERDEPEDSQGLGVYARYGHAPRDVYRISDYWSAGASWKGLIPTRDRDILAFGVSQAIYSSQYRYELHPLADRETVYECYYKWYVTPWFIVSPDLQVITNPGGDRDDRDALIGGVRIRVLF